jgi:hypothetical protein
MNNNNNNNKTKQNQYMFIEESRNPTRNSVYLFYITSVENSVTNDSVTYVD